MDALEAVAVAPYTLKIKLGDAEFDGTGPEESVRRDYEAFLDAMANVAPRSKGTATVGVELEDDHESDSLEQLWERAYLRKDEKLSLHVLPQSRTQSADSLLLLIYGYQTLMKQEAVRSVDLMEAAKQSGLRIDRIDRNLPASHKQFIIKGGNGKGSRYSLNNRGSARAQEMLEALFE